MHNDSIDRSRLSFDELDLLENKIIPEFKRWMRDYSFESNMFGHALDYLRKSGNLHDLDIVDRVREYQNAQDKNRRMTQADWDKHIRVLESIHPKKTKQQIIDRERREVTLDHLPAFITPLAEGQGESWK